MTAIRIITFFTLTIIVSHTVPASASPAQGCGGDATSLLDAHQSTLKKAAKPYSADAAAPLGTYLTPTLAALSPPSKELAALGISRRGALFGSKYVYTTRFSGLSPPE